LAKTENGSRGEQFFREVTIALRCLAPLPLKIHNDSYNITNLTLLIKFPELVSRSIQNGRIRNRIPKI